MANGPATGHLVLCFLADGRIEFHPETCDPTGLAKRLARLLRVLSEHPEAVDCATGACNGTCEHARPEVRA